MWSPLAAAFNCHAIGVRVVAGLAVMRARSAWRSYAFGICCVVALLAPTPAAALLAPTTTTVTASANPIPSGSPVTFTIAVTSGAGTPDGTVLILADILSLGLVTLDGTGHATFTTSTLPIGVHAIVAVYVGNLNFATSTSISLNINVSLAACTISVAASVNPLIFGTSVNLTATVSGAGPTPTGNVTLRAGLSVLGNATLGGGQGVLSVSTLAVGLLSISADYSGDANYLPCTAPILIVTVNKSSTTSAVTSSSNPSSLGAPVTYTATVSGTGGTPTGNVTFKDGVTVIGTGTLNGGGLATLVTGALGAGNHSITATYIGDSNFTGSTSPTLTQAVNQGTSMTTLVSSANPAASGSPVTFTTTVTGAGATPSGTVTFKDGVATIGTGTLNGSGQAALTTSALALGNHSITAVYGGDANFTGSSSSALAQVTTSTASVTALTATPNPAASGAPVTFAATVTGSGGTPTGSVTFKDGATTLSIVPLDGTGHASLMTSALANGSHSITAVYGGDVTFGVSTSAAVALQINGSGGTASTTALTATPNPAAPGAPATFTASVSGAGGTPTGTVIFKDGATTIGTVTLNGSGQAALVTNSLSSGTHSITAVYGGDATFAASTSPAIVFQVNPGGSAGTATATTLATSANPSVSGQPVTFTAAVAASVGSPTGTVTFKDSGRIIGTAALAGGSAMLTVSSLTVGSHAITASYGGDSTFAASVSGPLAQSISVPRDSIKLRSLQVVATRIVAQNSGQAISGAIDAAIDEGFSDADQMLAPSETGLRLSSLGYEMQSNGPNPARRLSPDWIVWSDLRHTTLSADGSKQDISGNQGNALAGITYRVMPDVLVGVFGGYESFNYEVASLNGHLRGDGWTAGGYAGWRILPGVRFDAGVAQSGIGYQAVAGTAAGSFPGSRTLFSSGLTGLYRFLPGVELEPSARVYALWEKESAYTDSLGTAQSDRSFSTGRASVGAKLTYRWAASGTTFIAPFAGVYADNYFNKDDAGAASILAAMQGTSARLLGGVAVTTDYGLKFSSAAELGGLGGNFTSWTFRARGGVPF